jgi:serine/threonine protein kinase
MAWRDTADEEQPLPAGTVIDGRYRLIAEIGAGGMGRVYEAEHMFLRRRMALKLLRGRQGSAEAAARMVQEATLAGQVPHPAIVRVFDCADLGAGRVYVAMELLRGETLAQALQRPGRALEILPWLADLARGLAAAHRVGVVHRDVKPANVVLVRDAADAVQAKLLDFGVAKSLPGMGGAGGVQTEAGAVLGTPYYLAPEQACGAALDGRADLYGLGVMLYEVLTGELPFVGDSFMAILAQHVKAPPLDPRQAAPERGIPDGVARLTMRLLAKDPLERPPDGDVVAEAITALLTSERAALERVVTGPRMVGLVEGTGAGTVRLGLVEGTGAGTVRLGLVEGTGAAT